MSSSCNSRVPAWTQVSKDGQASPVLSVTTCCRKSQRTLATRPRLKPIGILLSICLSTRLSLGDSLEKLGALAPGRQVGLTHEDIPMEEERPVCLPCQNLLTVMTVAPGRRSAMQLAMGERADAMCGVECYSNAAPG